MVPSYTAWWQRHVCKKLAQGCYLTAEPITSESRVQRCSHYTTMALNLLPHGSKNTHKINVRNWKQNIKYAEKKNGHQTVRSVLKKEDLWRERFVTQGESAREGVMDDESGEWTEEDEVTGQGSSESESVLSYTWTRNAFQLTELEWEKFLHLSPDKNRRHLSSQSVSSQLIKVLNLTD